MRTADIKADGVTPYKLHNNRVLILDKGLRPAAGSFRSSRADHVLIREEGGREHRVPCRDIEREWNANDDEGARLEVDRAAHQDRLNERMKAAGYTDTEVFVRKSRDLYASTTTTIRVGKLDSMRIFNAIGIETE